MSKPFCTLLDKRYFSPNPSESFDSFLHNGKLTISAELVFKALVNKYEPNSKEVTDLMDVDDIKKENSHMIQTNVILSKRMENMLVNAVDYLSDIDVVCSDGRIPCHANILAAGSTYFKDKFERMSPNPPSANTCFKCNRLLRALPAEPAYPGSFFRCDREECEYKGTSLSTKTHNRYNCHICDFDLCFQCVGILLNNASKEDNLTTLGNGRLSGDVLLTDLSMKRCFNLLEFIYTTKVDPAKINLELLEDAHNYGIHELMQHCSLYLINQIDSDNCVDVLILADELCVEDLKEAAKNFIVRNEVNFDKLEGNAKLVMEVARALQLNSS